jgi:hypothetical protein
MRAITTFHHIGGEARVGTVDQGTGEVGGLQQSGNCHRLELTQLLQRGFDVEEVVEVFWQVLADRPPVATLVRGGGEVEQPCAEVRVGDLVEAEKLFDLADLHALLAGLDPAELRA